MIHGAIVGEEAVKWGIRWVSALNRFLKLHPHEEHGLNRFLVMDILLCG